MLLFVLNTGKALLNVYQLSSVFFWPVFSLSYTVSLTFPIFCCQFVARGHVQRLGGNHSFIIVMPAALNDSYLVIVRSENDSVFLINTDAGKTAEVTL